MNKDGKLTVYLKDSKIQKLGQLAEREGLSKSAMARNIITRKLRSLDLKESANSAEAN